MFKVMIGAPSVEELQAFREKVMNGQVTPDQESAWWSKWFADVNAWSAAKSGARNEFPRA